MEMEVASEHVLKLTISVFMLSSSKISFNIRLFRICMAPKCLASQKSSVSCSCSLQVVFAHHVLCSRVKVHCF